MNADKKKTLERKRAACKAALTRMQTFAESFNPTTHTKVDLKVRYDKLPEIWQNYAVYQDELEFEDDVDHAPDREDFENKFYTVQSKYLVLMAPPADVNSHNAQSAGRSNTSSSTSGQDVHINLPTINLPKFSGNVAQWLHFKDTFEALIVNNPQLSNIQRLHYLLSSITGEAHQLVQNLPITNDNFQVAWKLVTRRYHNTKLIASTHVRELLHLPHLTKGSGANLRGLINHVQANVHALDALDIKVPLHEVLINHIIYESIDIETRKEWEIHSDSEEMPSFELLINFLERKCKALESISTSNEAKSVNKSSPVNNKPAPRTSHSYIVSVNNSSCILCPESHALYRCAQFVKMTSQQRFTLVKQHKRCCNCLAPLAANHVCSTQRCRQCNKKHHTMLHLYTKPSQSTLDTSDALPAQASNQEDQPTARKTYCTFENKVQSQVLLGTAVVTVQNKHGQYIHCRALLDSASQINFVTESLVQKLQLKKSKQHVPIQGINEVNAETSHTVSLNLKSRVSNYTTTIDCAVLPRITGTIPATYMNADSWEIPNDITLADEQFNQPGSIDLLIGAHIFYETLRPEKLVKPGNYPVLQDTELGWTIAGKTPIMMPAQSPQHVHFVRHDTSLETQVRRFWEIESIGLEQPVLSPEERLCEAHFSEHTTRQADGRFIVKLPTKVDRKGLGKSKFMAERRLTQIERRLDNDLELKAKYHAFMDDYETMQHMEQVKDEAIKNKDACFYIPHHPVFKVSSTTSTRVVFDASAKSTNGMSLNDILYTGPTIQQDLYSIVLRFRTHNIAIVADIEKMYRQILVHPDDQDLQRILWRQSPKDEVQTFKLTTVTYGTTCAPFLATRCLKQVAIDNEHSAAVSAKVIKEDFYVDDLLTGCSTLDEAAHIYEEVSTLLKQAGFPLRKWSSNCTDLLSIIPEELQEQQKLLSLDKEKNNISTLGLLWNPKTDHFHLKTGNPGLFVEHSSHSHSITKVTKRRVLSIIASIFDPLGLVSPIVISCKIFLQTLWQKQIGWDDPLAANLQADWQHLCEQIPLLSDINIPRNVLRRDVPTNSSMDISPVNASGRSHCMSMTPVDVQIHGFCDSSERAYGACLYVRTTYATGETVSNLLCAKSKVAPVKSTTLPRLELCGALLLAQLCEKAIPALNLQVSNTTLWTDSTLVLHWLAGSSSKWKTFVGNRVATIQELTATAQWRHVPTAYNPADLVSRGVEATTLKSCKLWWHGPEWLTQEPSLWPSLDVTCTLSDISETRKTFLTTRTAPEDWTQRYSKLSKLVRVTAYCRRFINNARVKKEERHLSFLTSKEMDDSLLTCVKLVQTIAYHHEISSLANHQEISSKSNLKSLTPFVDQHGLLRVGGRLQKSSLQYDAIHQLILPADHHFTNLVLSNEHLKLLHAGPQLLIASIRQRFWIPSIKRLARKMTHHCVRCFRLKAQASQQLMGELPSQRIQPTRPFRNVGVDYAGPVILKLGTPRSKVTTKGYIAVFVCLATKAVHLEVVTTLTTDAFVAALRRFIARRGKPSRIQSDNGTNFQGAAHQLHELYVLLHKDNHNQQVQDVLSQDNCDWVFIPPRAPHFGGLWEAAVKSMKYHLKRVIGDRVMSYEELATLLTQIEACMNSRPLCTISSDPHDFNYLSPGHFLIGEPLNQLPSVDLCDTNVNRLTRWQQVQQQLQQFWKRWHQDYLQELQQRRRWRDILPNLQAGAVVLLKEDNVPPLQWRLGVIVDIHKGQDNIVRVVSVKSSHGTFKRPITKVCLLPQC